MLTWQPSECSIHTPGDAVKENIKDATCTAAGSHDEVISCTNCGKELSRSNVTDKAPGHTEKPAEKENIKAPTCTVDGSHDEVVYCSVCKAGVSRTNVVDKAAGHKWNEGVVTTPSTTTAEGVRTFTCTVCQATRTESIPKIPTTPSRPGKPSVPAAKPVQSQKTGDAGIAVYAGLSLLSLTGGAWIIGKKKNED